MFFHKNNFLPYMGEDQAQLAAKLANEILDHKGVVLYGRSYADGSCKEFSTVNTNISTHVCIAVGMAEMGKLEVSKSPIRKDSVTNEDQVRAMEERAKLLAAENRQLRERLSKGEVYK